ncbi:MAG: DUF1569 domain-containing protein [Planctomycetaceae bacterium]|nr:DUF1569 domain-containing protein [Planctomycetaceae bacterium]
MDRRQLEFRNLDDAVQDARRLLQSGYQQAGNWNLSQVLGHCTDWLSFPLDGYPRPMFPINWLLWMAKITVGGGMRKKILRDRAFKPGSPTMPVTVKSTDPNQDAIAVEQFERMVERFKRHRGPVHGSPLFGKMTYEEHADLQVIHLQHHLSFLVPKSVR